MNPIADGPPIPPGSPLAVGRRAELVALLVHRGLVEVLDVVSAFTELCVRQEPDTAIDPLDDRHGLSPQSLLPDFRRRGRPRKSNARGRRGSADNDQSALTVRRLADPACRRIAAAEEVLAALKRSRPGFSRIRSNVAVVS